MTPFDPKSGEQDDQIEPMADVAMNDSTVSIKLGRYAAILSFFFTLIDKKKLTILFTFVFNSFQDLTFLKPFSLINVMAFELSFFLEVRNYSYIRTLWHLPYTHYKQPRLLQRGYR